MFARHEESSALFAVSAEELFAHADDFSRLSSHMSKSSWMMGGGSMAYELDDGRGQKVGSLVRMSGRVLGIALSLEERITERQPPHRKVWATTAPPELLVIGPYQLGFDIGRGVDGSREGTRLRVFIDYDLPEKAPARWLGYLFADIYARWCTRRMVGDAERHFRQMDERAS